ncbi:hypothetical protein [Hahella ganghwensis]|uniref:hypothetical protein n=1 Tax=Hahella ganghwensis TaxID=286420 RepID=UPI00037FF0C0|nr:hypothetical protein [Hahella ganghwensis]
MKLTAADYNILSYLLKTNKMSHEQAIQWACSQYSDEGIDPFIEKLSLASDVAEILGLISDAFHVYGEPDQKFLAGEAANDYFDGNLALYKAISRLLFDLALAREELQPLYIAEDLFEWHDDAESEAKKHALPLFNRYRAEYLYSVGKFRV